MKSHQNQGTSFDLPFSPEARGTRARLAMTKVHGLQLKDGYRGALTVGSQSAQVRLDPNDAIRIQMPVPSPHPAASALTANSGLPGNVRFARNGNGVELLADTQMDGELHLPATFQQIRNGFRLALGLRKPSSRNQASLATLDNQQVQDALDQLKWESDSIVVQDHTWELRPRVDAESVAVVLELDGERGDLCFHRTVLPCMPAKDTVQALACDEHSLRLNAQLRWARLARRQDRLVCEARLHAGLLQPTWLAMTARAVAVAYRHVHPQLRVLADQKSVAETYVRVLCTRSEAVALEDAAN